MKKTVMIERIENYLEEAIASKDHTPKEMAQAVVTLCEKAGLRFVERDPVLFREQTMHWKD